MPSPGQQSVTDAIAPPLYPDWAQGLLANPVSASLQPQANLLTPNDTSLARKMGDWAAQASGGRAGAQRLSDFVTNTAGMVPGVGAATAGNEARQAYNQGDYAGAGLNLAMGMIPGAAGAGEKTAAKVLEEAAAKPILQMGEEVAPRIIAYHGSPHTFDAFDFSHIGTGEGVTAYGRGGYFAGYEPTGQEYRNLLSPKGNVTIGGQPATPDMLYDIAANDLELPRARGVANVALNRMQTSDNYDEYLRRLNAIDTSGLQKTFPQVAQDVESEKLLAAELQNRGTPIAMDRPNRGSMYQVAINADPEHFLDWDKPLYQQTPHVQQALQSLGIDTQPAGQWTVKQTPSGHTVYNVWGEKDRTFKNADAAQAFADQRTAEHNAGGVGLAYTRLGGNTAYGNLDTGEASQKFLDAGIPGIKYLDAGSRAAGEGTHNYVVFDDKTIDILKRYGLAGLGLAGAGAVAPQMMQQQQPQGGT